MVGEQHLERRLVAGRHHDPCDERVRLDGAGAVDELAPRGTRSGRGAIGIRLRRADRGGQRGDAVHGGAKLVGKHEVRPGDGPAGGEDERPDAHRAVQLPRDAPPGAAPVDAQGAPPPRPFRPPDEHAGQAEQQEAEGADAVDDAAGGAGEEVEVEVLQHAHGRALGQLAQHLGGDGVDEHGMEASAVGDVGEVGGPHRGRRVDPGHPAARVRVAHALEHRRDVRLGTVGGGRQELRVRGPLQVDAEDEGGAGDRDDDDIECYRHPGPQMDLEQCAPQRPRTVQQAHRLSAPSAAKACAPGAASARDGRARRQPATDGDRETARRPMTSRPKATARGCDRSRPRTVRAATHAQPPKLKRPPATNARGRPGYPSALS